jgi:hypothetical protein
LMKLHNSGLLVVRRRARVKYPNAKLTDRGDARARALCGLPGRPVAMLFLAHAVEWGERFEPSRAGNWCERLDPSPPEVRWVPEIWFNNGRGWGDGHSKELSSVELDYLPGARLGWVRCTSSVRGNTAYAATPKGRAEFDNPSPFPKFGKLPAEDEDAYAFYRREQDAALLALETETPTRPNEIGELPAIHCLMGVQPKPVEGVT